MMRDAVVEVDERPRFEAYVAGKTKMRRERVTGGLSLVRVPAYAAIRAGEDENARIEPVACDDMIPAPSALAGSARGENSVESEAIHNASS